MEDQARLHQARLYRGAGLEDLERREPESEKFIRPQRRFADIVVRFAPIAGRDDPPGTPLSAELLLRPTIQHPALSTVPTDDHRTAMHLKIMRDEDGTPTDCLHVHGHASSEEARQLEKSIWEELNETGGPPSTSARSSLASGASRSLSPS